MESYQKGPTRHAYAWQIGPFWQGTLEKPKTVMHATKEQACQVLGITACFLHYIKPSHKVKRQRGLFHKKHILVKSHIVTSG